MPGLFNASGLLGGGSAASPTPPDQRKKLVTPAPPNGQLGGEGAYDPNAAVQTRSGRTGGQLVKDAFSGGLAENGDVSSFLFGKDAQKYDPNTAQAVAARNIGGPKHDFDVQAASAGQGAYARGSQAQGTQLNTANYDQDRSGQQGLLSGLNAQAAGQGPSAAVMAGNAQRDANLSQAAALQSGRRGQSAGVGIRAAGNQVSAGNQQASQTQAIGQANEMAAARGQQQGLLGTMAGQDIGVSGQNAQLGQGNNQFNANLGQQNRQFNAQSANQMSQFNANLGQNANLANQNAQLGIANAELQQRARQEGLSYSNLEPEQQGFLSPQNVGTFLGAGMLGISDRRGKRDARPVDGSYGRAMSPRDAKQDIQPASMQLPQLMGTQMNSAPGVNGTGFAQGPAAIGPNQRVNPNWGANSAAAYGNVIGTVLAQSAEAAALEAKQKSEDAQKQAESQQSQGLSGKDSGNGSGAGAGMASTVMSNPEILAAFSDRRSKEDARPASKAEAREMFEEAPPYAYFYKPDAVEAGAPRGRQVSVMWDDLQRTPAGRRMDGGREETTGYHTVDYLKGLPQAFASISDLNQRLSRLETGRR